MHEFDEFTESLIFYEHSERISRIQALFNNSDEAIKELQSNGFYIDNATKHCFTLLKGFTDDEIKKLAVRAYWILDTFISWHWELFLSHESTSFDLKDTTYAQQIFHCIDYLDLSSATKIGINWTSIFAFMALDRLSEIHFLKVKATEQEKFFLAHDNEYLQRIYIDLIDCSSKAQCFDKLVDKGWVKSLNAKINAAKRTDKLKPLIAVVLKRCIKECRDIDPQSAGNVIECLLVSENCPELALLKSEKRRAKTFSEWITRLRNGTLKVPL